MLAGGVSANRGLREKMKEQVAMLEDVQLSLPPMKCCTDNAMMIALAGKVMYDNNKFSDLSLGIKPHLDLELESIGGDQCGEKNIKSDNVPFSCLFKSAQKNAT